MATGDNFREWRLNRGLTQTEAADILGLRYQQRISEIERDIISIPLPVEKLIIVMNERDHILETFTKKVERLEKQVKALKDLRSL